jgi:hypothetical protein
MTEGVPALKGSAFGMYAPDSVVVKRVAGNERLPVLTRRKIVGHLVGYRKVRGPKKTKEQKAAAKADRKALKKSIYGPLGLVSERKKFTPEQKKARRSAKGKLTRQIRADWARNNPEEAAKMGFNVGRLGKSTQAKKPKAKAKGKGKKK